MGLPLDSSSSSLRTLPGIGRKSGRNGWPTMLLASPRDEAMRLAEAIRQVKDAVHPCSQCFNLTEGELCTICRDPKRQRHTLCIVEQPRDVVALEAAGVFQGLYHVLQGRISPLEGVGPEDLTIGPLMQPRAKYRGHRNCNGYKSDGRRGWNGSVYLEPARGRASENHAIGAGIPTGSVLLSSQTGKCSPTRLMGRQEF